jgi:hypothetical protein
MYCMQSLHPADRPLARLTYILFFPQIFLPLLPARTPLDAARRGGRKNPKLPDFFYIREKESPWSCGHEAGVLCPSSDFPREMKKYRSTVSKGL